MLSHTRQRKSTSNNNSQLIDNTSSHTPRTSYKLYTSNTPLSNQLTPYRPNNNVIDNSDTDSTYSNIQSNTNNTIQTQHISPRHLNQLLTNYNTKHQNNNDNNNIALTAALNNNSISPST